MLKYLIDGKEFEEKEDVIDYIIDNANDEIFDDMLDDVYGDIEICGIHFNPSTVLYKCDKIAYNCYKGDYYDSLRDDISDWLDNQENRIFTFYVEYIEDEDDDMIRCEWCGELVYETECRKELNLGMICKDCQCALSSRGEKPIYED